MNGSTNDSSTLSSFHDINGDGLVDYIYNNVIYINTGTGYYNLNKQVIASESNRTIQIGINTNLSVNFYFPNPLGISPKVGFGGGYGLNSSFNFEKVRFMDFNGDGYLDIVSSNKDSNLSVSYSNIRRTNMLKKIIQPTGSVITLDYSTKNEVSKRNFENTFKMPFKKWVLSSVEIFDGFPGDGVDVQKYSFEYYNGFKDRRERKFLGFGEVHSHQMRTDGTIFRTTVEEYMLNSLTDNEAKQPSNYSSRRKSRCKYYTKFVSLETTENI